MTESYEEYLSKSKAYYNVRFGAGRDEEKPLLEEERIRWEHIGEAVARAVAGREKPARILDFGCGTGWMSHRLAAYGRVTGVDLSNEAIDKAKENYPGIEFLCIDASSKLADVLPGDFDVVVSSEVIEHIVRQEEYMDNLVSLLAGGGTLVLTTPNGRWKDHFYHGARIAWAQPYELWLTADRLRDFTGGKLRDVTVGTFYSRWLFDMPSFGMPHFLGNRLFRVFFRMLGLSDAYRHYLEKKGYGIYLLFEGRK